jgi:hypothetical protein
MAVVKNLMVRCGADFSQLTTATKKAQVSLTGMKTSVTKSTAVMSAALTKFAGIAAAAFSVRALVNFGKEAINIASDLQEVQNVVDVAFGDMSYKIEEFAKKSIEAFGMSQLSSKRTASTYMAMAKSMGIASDSASDMAVELTARTADMASFHNVTQDVADTALKSVFTGETESLKKFGIVMTEVNLQEFARRRGINKSISAMEQAEKTQLRFEYVLDKSSIAAGDFARTSDSWANQTRVLSERWKEFQGIMGQGLIQALTPALKFLNYMMSMLNKFAQVFSEVTAGLFGKQTAVATSATEAATGEQEFADGITAASKAAKKALAPFDELNVLQQDTGDMAIPTSGTSSSGSPGINDLEEIELPEGMKKWIADIRTELDKIKPKFDEVKKSIEEFIATIELVVSDPTMKEVIKWFKNFASIVASNQIQGTLMVINGALKVVTGQIKIALGWWKVFFGSATLNSKEVEAGLKLIEEGFGDVATGAAEMAGGLFKANPVPSLVESVLPAKTKSDLQLAFDKYVKPLFTKEGWESLFYGVGLGFRTGWAGVVSWWQKSGLSKWWKDDVVSWFTVKKWEGLFNGMIEGWKLAWANVIKWWNNTALGQFLATFGIKIESPYKTYTAHDSGIPSSPHLATGAVIPPNKEFLATLGDQTSGNNLELPEGLLRQIVREEGGGGITFTGPDDIMQLVRMLNPKLTKDTQLRGTSLIVGGI